MTFGEKIFFFIFGFRFLVATTVPLEFSLVPKINCFDLNRNGNPDFIALSNSASPRTIYHIEVFSSKTEILWEFTMPETKKGYFVDMILGDFDKDGVIELIATAYQDDSNDIFYIFSLDEFGYNGTPPTITGIKNISSINNPRRLYKMQPGANGQSLFLFTQGSPNRQVVMCEYSGYEIISVGFMGKEFLKNTMSLIDIALGDFDGDGGEDIFILDNGFTPSGYIIYSDGKEMSNTLNGYPRLKYLHKNGVDLNFDGTDDIIMVNRSGELMSNIWGNEPLSFSKDKINSIIIKSDNGFVYLTSITKSGKIENYSLDPLTRSILSSEIISPKFNHNGYKTVHSLITQKDILLFHDGNNPELWLTSLAIELITDTPPPLPIQRIYNRNPDYVINVGDNFSHLIQWETSATFRNFTEEFLPENMEFDLDELTLNWIPRQVQLGYHELSYKLELREKGNRKLASDNGKIYVSQNEPLSEKPYSFLLYVNDPISFQKQQDSITIVNGELFEWIIPIDDDNADAQLSIKIISGEKSANYDLLQPEITLVPVSVDNKIEEEPAVVESEKIVEIEPEVKTDTAVPQQETIIENIKIEIEEPIYVDSIRTQYEKFAEEKLESEEDPFKKTKQESSVEEFKTMEEEYREKLKTHKKILKDGKNIWIPIDSLLVSEDSTTVEEPKIENPEVSEVATIPTSDSLSFSDKTGDEELIVDNIEEIPIDSLLVSEDSTTVEEPKIENPEVSEVATIPTSDSLSFSDKTGDEELIVDNIEEISSTDNQFVEITYAELVKHKTQFSWLPHTAPGDYNFTIAVTDGFTSDTSLFTITVHPEIDLSLNKTHFTATVDQMFNTSLILKPSSQSEKYNFNLIDAPENMKIDTTGTINWVPLPTQVDDYNFQLEVTDGIATSRLQYEIYVNAPPVISSRPREIFILPLGEQLNFPMENFDMNTNTKLKWKLLSGPTDMALNSQGVLSWGGFELGHHPYEIQLTDGIDSVQWEASIYVNAPPVITSKPVVAVPEGERYEYPLFAIDENTISPKDSLAENIITFSLAQGPEGMKIENNILVWETNDNHLGEYMVAITANDGVQDAIQVFPVFINSFPVITSPDSVTVQLGDTLRMQIEAYDPNPGDSLTFHLDSLRNGLVLELHNGLLTWSPKNSDIGLHKFTLQVKDGHDNTGTGIPFQIYVYRPPLLTSELSTEAFVGLEYAAFITAEDLYGEKLSSSESIQIDSASFNYYNLHATKIYSGIREAGEYAHLFKWTPRDVDKGDHEFIIRITDEHGFITLHHHKLSVFTNPCVQCNNDEMPADSTGN